MDRIVDCSIYDGALNFIKIEQALELLVTEVVDEDVAGFRSEVDRHASEFPLTPTYWESIAVVELETLMSAGPKLAEGLEGELRIYTHGNGHQIKFCGSSYLPLIDEWSLHVREIFLQGFLQRPRRPGLMTEYPESADCWDPWKAGLVSKVPYIAFGDPDFFISVHQGTVPGTLKISSMALVKQ